MRSVGSESRHPPVPAGSARGSRRRVYGHLTAVFQWFLGVPEFIDGQSGSLAILPGARAIGRGRSVIWRSESRDIFRPAPSANGGRLMRKIRTAVLASVAALTAVGTAMAANHINHVMRVDLPDGSVARIEYQGDVAPQVRVDPAIRFAPVRIADPFGPDAFAMFDRIMADMDRQTEAMMRQVRALEIGQPATGGLDLASFGDLPAGSISYSFVSTSNGKS